MGNCKDCKYWIREQYSIGQKAPNVCDAVDVSDSNFDAVEASGFGIYITVSDDYGLRVGLKTGPLFGCVKFEQRPEAA